MSDTLISLFIAAIFIILIYLIVKVFLLVTSTKYIVVFFDDKMEILTRPISEEGQVNKILVDLYKLTSKNQTITITELIVNNYFGLIRHTDIGKVDHDHIYWNYHGIRIDRGL